MNLNKPIARVLVVDDDEDFQMLLSKVFTSQNFSVEQALDLSSMKAIIAERSFDLVLLDLRLGQENGLDAIPFIFSHGSNTKIIVMTAYSSVESAVTAMKLGAANFLAKSTDIYRIVEEVKMALDDFNLDYSEHNPYYFECAKSWGLIGKSQSFYKTISQIFRIKDVNSNVLIYGESGTGKELIAKAIHQSSNRANKIFRAINCGAIPENLLESELFGYRKGAFTDAKSDRKGIFEICSEGTLLLDEIGEMPLALQVKLLRVLQENEITPIGTSTPIKINTRVLASTNKNLKQEVRAGRFREDLYYRLSVLQIENAPLRERLSDITLLVNHFINLFNKQFNRHVRPPAPEVLVRLLAYDWPGNIRELKNCIERGVVLSKNNEIKIEDIFPRECFQIDDHDEHNLFGNAVKLTLPQAKNLMESNYIKKVLAATKGNISEASRISGLYRANFYRLMEKHHITIEEFKKAMSTDDERRLVGIK